MKADFKSQEAVDAGIPLLFSLKSEIQAPLFLNADILPGPGSGPTAGPTSVKINGEKFIKICSEFFPEATLSVGWTTSTSNYSEFYTWEMVINMAKLP